MATTRPSMKFITTTSDKLASISVVAGQLIFCSDTRVIYLDTNKRNTYQAVINVIDDETRQAIEHPLEGYYYVRTENTLWSYFNGWAQITGKDSSLIFADEGLPEEGIEGKIYVSNSNMYRWNKLTREFFAIAGGNSWEIYTA